MPRHESTDRIDCRLLRLGEVLSNAKEQLIQDLQIKTRGGESTHWQETSLVPVMRYSGERSCIEKRDG